jgi:quercetin dioxygenase-like cupin family protein
METAELECLLEDVDAVTALDAAEISHLRWQPVGGCPGVRGKELWRTSHAACAVIAYEVGAVTPGHPHPDAEHHLWVISGVASVAGRNLPAGSYAHVPPAVAHPIAAVGGQRLILLQLHQRRQAFAGAEACSSPGPPSP